MDGKWMNYHLWAVRDTGLPDKDSGDGIRLRSRRNSGLLPPPPPCAWGRDNRRGGSAPLRPAWELRTDCGWTDRLRSCAAFRKRLLEPRGAPWNCAFAAAVPGMKRFASRLRHPGSRRWRWGNRRRRRRRRPRRRRLRR